MAMVHSLRGTEFIAIRFYELVSDDIDLKEARGGQMKDFVKKL